MERTEALKPCPFCKGNATLTANGLFDMRYQVQCDTRYSSTGASTNADKVIAHWNTRSTPAPADKAEVVNLTTSDSGQLLDALRQDGWMVAVHNDYRLNGEVFTFWLLTKGNQCVKGEGRTDKEALVEVYRVLPPQTVDYEAGARAFTTTLSSLGFPVPHRSDVLQATTACINAALQPAAKEG